jgi:hypothetical protein
MKKSWPVLILMILSACGTDVDNESLSGPSAPFEGAEKASPEEVTAQGYCSKAYYLHNGDGVPAGNAWMMIHTQYPSKIYGISVTKPKDSSWWCSRDPMGYQCSLDFVECRDWTGLQAVEVVVHYDCGYPSRISSYYFGGC